jgi:oxalate decarboxylase/phosphoglucose isomerase-like protein (cupin superfamily)
MHFHGHAANTLAYGLKKWYLFAPSEAFYSKTPAIDFVREGEGDDSSEGRGTRSSLARQCTQRPGDVLYVPPLWSHATLNLQASIGVAHEFSMEDFCME